MKNVILLTIDALRKDATGCYGSRDGLTPFIDSLQKKCLKFTREQAAGPYTQASFPGLLTSSYYLDYGKPKGLAPERTLVSEPLQKAGVTTAGFHSNPYMCEMLGWNRGWDVFYDSMQDEVDSRIPYIRGNVINAKVRDWLSAHTRDDNYKPFFLWLHYMDIHEPYMPEEKYLAEVNPSLNISRDEMYSLFQGTLLKRDASDPQKVALLRQLYNAHVPEIDDYVKEFFAILKELDILADSTIIITSDHGDEFNEHGGLSHDDKLYSELIDTPLLIYDPSRSKPETCDTLVSNVDIPPTIVHLFGLEAVAGFQGHSLLPLEKYPEKGVFSEALDQLSQRGGDIDKDVYSYRKGDLKIIYRANLDTWEMYDLEKDSGEVNNIASTSPQAEEFKSKLMPRVRRWAR